MVHSVNSAIPEMLYRYASYGIQIDHDLTSKGESLVRILSHFEQRCKESAFRVTASALGGNLKSYGSQNTPVDELVQRVGQQFALADGMRISTNAGTAQFDEVSQGVSVRTSWISNAVVEAAMVTLLFVPIIGPPAWIVLKAGGLSWIKSKTLPTNNRTALGDLMAESQTDTSSDNSQTDVASQSIKSSATPELSDQTSTNNSLIGTAKLNIQATTKDCVAFVKDQPNRKVPSGVFNKKEFYSGSYKGKSGKLSDGTEYSQEPKAGAIMVESQNTDVDITTGHASYVYEVDYDANGKAVSYKIAEGNWGEWGDDGKTPPPIHYDEFHWDPERNCYISKSGKRSPDIFIH